MQRVAIALELVLRDLQVPGNDEKYVSHKGSFWKLAFEASNRVVEAVFAALQSRGAQPRRMRLLPRSIIPTRAACGANSETARDLRDWVILSNSMTLTNFYKKLFMFYSLSRQQSSQVSKRSRTSPSFQTRPRRSLTWNSIMPYMRPSSTSDERTLKQVAEQWKKALQ